MKVGDKVKFAVPIEWGTDGFAVGEITKIFKNGNASIKTPDIMGRTFPWKYQNRPCNEIQLV